MKINRKLVKDHAALAFSWMAFLLALVLVYANFASGIIDRAFFYHSDTLNMPAFYRDIFQEHGSFFDWRFSASPFFFPDMPLYCLANFIIPNFHLAIVFCGVLQQALFMLGLIWLSGRMLGRRRVVQCALLLCGALFFIQASRTTPTDADRYFYFSGICTIYHFGALLIGVYVLAMLMKVIDHEFSRKSLARSLAIPLGIFLLSALTVASDLFYVLQIVIPLLLGMFFLFLLARLTLMRLVSFSLPLVLAVPAGIALTRSLIGNMNAVKDYIHFGPSAINQACVGVWQWGAEEIQKHRPLAVIWVLFMVASLLVIMGAIRRASRQEPINRHYVLFFVFFLLSFAVNLGGLVFTGQSAPRYFIPYYIIPTFFGWPLLLGGQQRLVALLDRFWIHHAAALALVAYLVATMVAPPKSKFAELAKWRDYYPDSVRLLDNWARPRNFKNGVSDYWNAKYCTMFSKTGLHVVQVYSSLHIQLWINSKAWYNREFDFIMPHGLMQDRIYSRFGKPKEVLYQGNSPLAMAYDTPQFRRQFIGGGPK